MAARVLLISGSTRGGSTNTALLRTAEAVPPAEVEPVLYGGMTGLPHFNPDDDVDPLPAAVADLRAQIGGADAVLFCTPEYAGALPGTFKNLLDWTVGGPEMYGKPVAWVNASASPTRAAQAHASLEIVLRTIHADVVAEACAHIAVGRGRRESRRARRRPGCQTAPRPGRRDARAICGHANRVGSDVSPWVNAAEESRDRRPPKHRDRSLRTRRGRGPEGVHGRCRPLSTPRSEAGTSTPLCSAVSRDGRSPPGHRTPQRGRNIRLAGACS